MSCSHPLSKTNFASSFESTCEVPGGANDHVVPIGLSVDRDSAECGPFDLHGLILSLTPGPADQFPQIEVPAWTPLVPLDAAARAGHDRNFVAEMEWRHHV